MATQEVRYLFAPRSLWRLGLERAVRRTGSVGRVGTPHSPGRTAVTAHRRSTRLSRSAARIAVLAAAALVLAVPPTALAARPVPGGRDLLMQTFQPVNDGISAHMGVLQVAPNGRALTSEGVPYSPVSVDYFGSKR